MRAIMPEPLTTPPVDTEEVREFALPQQREKVFVRFGGISTWHVVRLSTFRSGVNEGWWTRKGCDYRSLCGSLSYCMVGIDALDWPLPGQDMVSDADFERVNCARCRKSYESRARKATT